MDTRCEQVRAAASAHLDAESGPVTPADVTLHADECPACHDHVVAITRLDRSMRLAAAPAVPDLSARVVAAVDLAGDVRRTRQRRWVVAMTGLVMVVLAAGPLVGLASQHAQREVALLELAIGVAVILVAWRPRHGAPGLFPVVAVVSVLIAATALLDVSRGLTTLVAESAHLPVVIATVLLWHWARPAWRSGRSMHVEVT